MAGKRNCQKTKRSKQPPETSIFDTFSPINFKKIPPTSTKKDEDVFHCLRPNKGECLDYNISETVLKMEAGDVKINVKDTKATYVPAPPIVSKKKKKLETPPYKFITEMWLEEQNMLQEKYKKENRRNFKHQRTKHKLKTGTMHNLILSMVGPEWFQELSPNQLRTVDQLECCILTDIKNNTITEVQENIRKLGLVLRPNHRHVEKALHLCCKNPVEFLLILYQIMNPRRREYSLNDRLLLSAVVHLCMGETLRELHIRIPSPPVHKRIKIERPKVEKKIRYASPYLEPLFFTSASTERPAVYENPHIQYPESPYFSYLQSLDMDRLTMNDIFELDITTFDPEDAELLEDMRRAQLLYDQIRKGDRVKLLRPTIMQRCDVPLFRKKQESLTSSSLSTFHNSEDEKCFCSEITKEESSTCSEYETAQCECQEKCDCKKKSKMFTTERKQDIQRVIKGITITPDNEAVSVIEATLLQKTCDCMQRYMNGIVAAEARNHLQCQKAEYIIGGVAMTSEGPVYIVSTALKKIKTKFIIDSNLSEQPEQEGVCLEKQLEFACNKGRQEIKEKNDNEKCQEEGYSKHTCQLKNQERCTSTNSIQESCTWKNDTDETNEDDLPSSPCDCTECECKERSKIYTGRRCIKCQEKERQKYLERIITGLKETTSHKIVPIIEGMRALPSCDCLQNYAERILSMEAKNKILSQKAQFIVGGVAFTKRGPVYILSAVLQSKEETYYKPKKISRCKERIVEEEEEINEEAMKYSGCKCKQELERFLNHKCTCEECNIRERHREGVTYIMGGTKTKGDKSTVNIVHGVYEQRCDCLAKYKEKIDKLEDYRKRIEIRYNLKSQTLKYSIGGVVNGPNGPVYVITGMRPPVECECAKAIRKKEEQEQHSREMAKMPPTGRIKYQITGVRHTPEGNVFIISQALAIDDCECVKLYNTYTEAHKACLDMYESFLEQTNKALEEYKSETVESCFRPEIVASKVTECTNRAWNKVIDISEIHSQNSFSKYNLFEKGEVVRGIIPKCPGQKLNICSRGGVISLSGSSILSQCVCCESDDEEETLSESSEESQRCAIFLEDFGRSNAPVEEKAVVQAEVKRELKRFVILKKIPRDYKKQLEILKKVLATMAEDEFPVAKLPDCHKLPHFKLWMQMRCGKFWRQKDINSYEAISNVYWNHTDICPIKYTVPSLGISKKQAKEMTWKEAKYIKKIVGDKTEMFYRQISQNAVDSAREFFPISFSYEFPNKTFRDVFFAYLPSKEKDIFAHHIVKPHDARFISKRYSCYC